MKPNITWIGSPNFSEIKGYKFIAIVDHIMSGSLSGTDSWFSNPSSGVSSHFGVGKNGDIHQYVNIDHPAWANGIVKKPNWSLLTTVNPNYYTISIEHEGYSGEEFTEAQYQSSLALHRWLISELGIIPNSDTIIGHYRINSVDKSNCPGSGFPWSRLFKDLNSTFPIPSPTPDNNQAALRFSYPNNAKIINDDLFIRDINGNKLNNRYVSNGDNVTILDVSYSKQLVLIEYPTTQGVKSGYVKNVPNCIHYYFANEWYNGHTSESIIDESGRPLGSLNPLERATPLYRKNGLLQIVYNTSLGVNTKSGFVHYSGGFTKF